MTNFLAPGPLVPEPSLSSRLYPHEVGMTVFLLMAVAVVFLNNSITYWREGGPALDILEPMANTVTVRITGEVAKPGSYELPEGSRLADLLARAEPSREADLRDMKPRSKLHHGASVLVHPYRYVQVTVKGAVQREGVYKLPEGARPKEFAGWLPLTPDADVARLARRRKRASEGMLIQVPRLNPSKCD